MVVMAWFYDTFPNKKMYITEGIVVDPSDGAGGHRLHGGESANGERAAAVHAVDLGDGLANVGVFGASAGPDLLGRVGVPESVGDGRGERQGRETDAPILATSGSRLVSGA